MSRILWADDEIDLLRPSVLFLEQKGYEVVTATNGADAVDLCRRQSFDIVFLDENMPGLSGLEALADIKAVRPSLPVVMITKSEEENIMDQAIGSKIADYLIKPVRPQQILAALKKHVQGREIVTTHTTSAYREEFADISYVISSATTIEEFFSIHRTLTRWELRLQEADEAMRELLRTQQADANRAFERFIRQNYASWLAGPDAPRPLMSHELIRRKVFPLCDAGERVCLIVIDNFRYDQWLAVMPMVEEHFDIVSDDLCCSILPTATQYARNALFAGLMPLQIKEMYPSLWVDEGDEESKNLNEQELLSEQLRRYRKTYSSSYFKVNESGYFDHVMARIGNTGSQLNAVVINFIDMLSHSRTESRMMRELASDEAAYLSLTRSWFRHSPVRDLLARLAREGYKVILTTDHGTVRVDRPVKVAGDRLTNTNLRYKLGKTLGYDARQVFEMADPRRCGLPAPNLSTAYIFATGSDFFAYPNNYNHYVSYYRDTFQHGGLSMEEMLIPAITLRPKGGV